MTARASTSGEGGNYEYVTARVRSRKAALFDDDDYRKLVRMGQGQIARFMEDTEYEQEMNALGARHSGIDLVEYALNRNLAKHFDDLLRWANGRLYADIARYLRKFDAWNVKTIVRGIYAGEDPEAVADDLINAGEFSEQLLEELRAASTIQEVVERCEGTIFAENLQDALRDFEETNSLVPIENAVDRAFYETLLDDLPGGEDRATELYVQFLTAEIDFRNLRNALRLSRSGADLDPSEYFIAGGRLFDESEVRQLAANTDQLLEHIRASVYGEDLEAALDDLDEAADLIEFEHALEAAQLEYADRLSNRYPLSICPVLSYVLSKEREVANVRAIARGREAGLSPEEIEQDLVIH